MCRGLVARIVLSRLTAENITHQDGFVFRTGAESHLPMVLRSLHYLNDMIQFSSVSTQSNRAITDCIERWLTDLSFKTERLDYQDEEGTDKSCVIARKGPLGSGLAYFGHSDVVPVDSWSFAPAGPWDCHLTEDRVYGRGSCDMKGSIACMLAAVENLREKKLHAPVYIAVTADEEIGMRGAREIVSRSSLYREIVASQSRTLVGEPTQLQVVYAHKGGCALRITSHGRAAHSSTGQGLNANLAMIPFLSEIRKLHDEMESSPAWRDERFVPPTPTMNITIRDNSGALNITAPRCVVMIYFRPMPGQDTDGTVDRIQKLARLNGLQCETVFCGSPVFTNPDSPFIRELLSLTNNSHATTVAYGTDGVALNELQNVAILGPGSIEQAHTDDEWISLEQLERGTALFEKLIRHWCIQPE